MPLTEPSAIASLNTSSAPFTVEGSALDTTTVTFLFFKRLSTKDLYPDDDLVLETKTNLEAPLDAKYWISSKLKLSSSPKN